LMSISLIQHSGTLITYGRDRSAEGAADQAPQQRTADAPWRSLAPITAKL
jgi:hypothetical protein